MDIYNIIFTQILKVTPTGDVTADFLNLIFFPHILILIWLFIVARAGPIGKSHPGIGTLLAVAIYVFVIYYGWYAMIASLSVLWIALTAAFGLFYVVISRFYHPGSTAERFGLGEAASSFIKRRREIDAILIKLKKDQQEAESKLRTTLTEKEKVYWTERLNAIKDKIYELEREKKVIK